MAALEIAQQHFRRVSFDLIYALPGDTEDSWSATLAQALSLGTSHLSLYQLTIEPGTRFAALHAAGKLEPLDADAAAALYELTDAMTSAAGLPAYEISNHARRGHESRHNLTYWRYGDYAGVGPGAHGRRLGMRTVRHRKPENFLVSAAAQRPRHCRGGAALGRSKRLTKRWSWACGSREGIDADAIAAPLRPAVDRRLGESRPPRRVGSSGARRQPHRADRVQAACCSITSSREIAAARTYFGGCELRRRCRLRRSRRQRRLRGRGFLGRGVRVGP